MISEEGHNRAPNKCISFLDINSCLFIITLACHLATADVFIQAIFLPSVLDSNFEFFLKYLALAVS